jgi:hypothetical protein
MNTKLTALAAAAFLAVGTTLAMAQAGGGAGGGGGAAGGAGSEVSTPRANSGPGGPSKRTMATKPVMKRQVHKRKRHHHS